MQNSLSTGRGGVGVGGGGGERFVNFCQNWCLGIQCLTTSWEITPLCRILYLKSWQYRANWLCQNSSHLKFI